MKIEDIGALIGLAFVIIMIGIGVWWSIRMSHVDCGPNHTMDFRTGICVAGFRP